MVFGTLALFDVLVLVLIIISIAFGWYGDNAEIKGANLDGGSDAPEKATNLEDAGF